MITNGPAAVVALGDPPRVRIVAGEPPAELTIGATYAGPTPEQLDERSGPGIIAVPIESDLGRQGWLIVYPDAGSLFLEDDLVLLRLLTTQAARANERREAIRQQGVLESELEDASHELATSRAQLESEARFRAALEAHPGILLVIEPGGRIGYANGQALRSLGYDANAIRRVGLSELLARDPAAERRGPRHRARRDGATARPSRSISRSARSNRAGSCRGSRSSPTSRRGSRPTTCATRSSASCRTSSEPRSPRSTAAARSCSHEASGSIAPSRASSSPISRPRPSGSTG